MGQQAADRGGPVVRTTGRTLLVTRAKLLASALLAGACGPTDSAGPRSVPPPRVPLGATPPAPATPAAPNVLVGAGQIADSTKPNSPFTANLLDTIPGTVFTLGDNAYLDGSATAFTREYDPYWGRQKGRTRPAPGNHDYLTSGGAGYFGYFGTQAGDPGKGYYSFDLGDWHIVSLNSTTGAGAGSTQDAWLRADLAATTKLCLLAYFHHPRFFSSYSTSVTSPNSYLLNFWTVLYAAQADLVLNGHFYHYERFAPQNASGGLDVAKGIREIIVGTGGAGHDATVVLAPNSEVRNSDTYGVLKLALSADGSATYSWTFIPIAGKTFTDTGSGTCHRAVMVSPSLSTVAAAPASITAGGATTTITVTAKDGSGNPVTGATVVLAATGNGNTLTQPAGPTNASGVATGTLSSTVAEGKTISATANGAALTQQPAVTVTAGAATQLTLTTQPSTTAQNGVAFAQQPVVQLRDANGNAVSQAGGTVTAAIATGAGTLGGTLTATTLGSGVVSFTDLAISGAVGDRTLHFTAPGLTEVVSGTITITAGAATQLTLTTQPSTTAQSGVPLAQQPVVQLRDANGNAVSQAGGTVTAAIATGGGTFGGPP